MEAGACSKDELPRGAAVPTDEAPGVTGLEAVVVDLGLLMEYCAA